MAAAERLIVVVLFDSVDLLDVTGPPESSRCCSVSWTNPPATR